MFKKIGVQKGGQNFFWGPRGGAEFFFVPCNSCKGVLLCKGSQNFFRDGKGGARIFAGVERGGQDFFWSVERGCQEKNDDQSSQIDAPLHKELLLPYVGLCSLLLLQFTPHSLLF